jgi:hypothetical protein
MRLIPIVPIIILAAFAGTAYPQEGIQQVTEHWSPYPYPTDFPPGSRVYIIVSGDTLWDIAGRTYANHLVWPQIHAANQYITNPHLIYPGDPLILPEIAIAEAGRVTERPQPQPTAEEAAAQPEQPETAGAEEATPPEGERPEAAAQPEVLPTVGAQAVFATEPRPSRQYYPALRDLDLYCSSTVYPKVPDTDIWIIGVEFKGQMEVDRFDIVYLNQGRDRLKAGDLFQAADKLVPVDHPYTKKRIGYAYQEVGIVQVILASKNYAVAEVLYSCDGLSVGALLIPFEQRTNPMSKLRSVLPKLEQYLPLPDGPYGAVVFINYIGMEAMAEDTVNIDLGSRDGLKTGDRFLVVRERWFKTSPKRRFLEIPSKDYLGNNKDVVNGLKRKVAVRRVIAEAVVFKILDSTASLKITYAVDFLNIGDRVIPIKQVEQYHASVQ